MATIFDEIPFDAEARRRIEASIQTYRRFARVRFEMTLSGAVLQVRAVQYEPAPNGRVLTADELRARALGVFEGLLPGGYELVITSTPYQDEKEQV